MSVRPSISLRNDWDYDEFFNAGNHGITILGIELIDQTYKDMPVRYLGFGVILFGVGISVGIAIW